MILFLSINGKSVAPGGTRTHVSRDPSERSNQLDHQHYLIYVQYWNWFLSISTFNRIKLDQSENINLYQHSFYWIKLYINLYT